MSPCAAASIHRPRRCVHCSAQLGASSPDLARRRCADGRDRRDSSAHRRDDRLRAVVVMKDGARRLRALPPDHGGGILEHRRGHHDRCWPRWSASRSTRACSPVSARPSANCCPTAELSPSGRAGDPAPAAHDDRRFRRPRAATAPRSSSRRTTRSVPPSARRRRPPGRSSTTPTTGPTCSAPCSWKRPGRSVLDYARSRLFDPLGIPTRPVDQPLGTAEQLAGGSTRFGWAVDRSRICSSAGAACGCGLATSPGSARSSSTRAGGEGRQLVPQNWARVASLTQVLHGFEIAPGYGYGWWVDERNEESAYYAFGYGGQLIEVLPRQGHGRGRRRRAGSGEPAAWILRLRADLPRRAGDRPSGDEALLMRRSAAPRDVPAARGDAWCPPAPTPRPTRRNRARLKQLLADVGAPRRRPRRPWSSYRAVETVAERYFQGPTRTTSGTRGSVTKSVLSTLVGIAIDEGLIDDVDDDLGTLLPSHREPDVLPPSPQPPCATAHMTGGFDDDAPRLLADLAAKDPLGRVLSRSTVRAGRCSGTPTTVPTSSRTCCGRSPG